MKIKTSLALLSTFLGSFTLFAQTQTDLNTQPPSYSSYVYSFGAILTGGTLTSTNNNALGDPKATNNKSTLDILNMPLSTAMNISVLTTNAYGVMSNNIIIESFPLNIPTTFENVLSSTNIVNNQNYNGYKVVPFRENDTTGLNGITCLLLPSCHGGEATPKMEMNPSTIEEGTKAVREALRVLEEEQVLLRE